MAGPCTLEQLAGDVAALLDRVCGGEPVDVVGHSLGGKTAMALALSRPELVRKLVVVDIAPVTYNTTDPQWKSVDAIVRAAHALDPTKYKNRGEIDAVLAKAVSDPGVRSFVAQNLVPHENGTYTWRINTGALVESLVNFAVFPSHLSPPASSSAPSLMLDGAHFIAGEKSTYLRPEHHATVKRLFPGAKFYTVAGSGHWVHAEKPKEFWSVLASILGLTGSWP